MVTSWGAGFSFLTENRRTSVSLCHFLYHQDLMGRCWGDFSASWNPENDHQMVGSLTSCCPLIPSSALPVFPKSLFCTEICSLFFFLLRSLLYIVNLQAYLILSDTALFFCFINLRSPAILHQASLCTLFFQHYLLTSCLCVIFW